MTEARMKAVVERLESVERENRRLKRAGVAALAVGAAVVLMGQAVPSQVAKLVEAEQFVLRDRSGKARAWLNVADGAVNLALADKNERSRTLLYVMADGTNGLILATEDGKTRVEMKLGANSVPTFSLTDKDNRRIGFFVLADGRPALGLVDRTNRVRSALGLEADGKVRLMLSDKNATERAELAVLPEGTPRLTLIGHAGRLVWHGP